MFYSPYNDGPANANQAAHYILRACNIDASPITGTIIITHAGAQDPFQGLDSNQIRQVLDKARLCPRCLAPIPRAEQWGVYPGALSRTDSASEICSHCGIEEASEHEQGNLIDQSRWLA